MPPTLITYAETSWNEAGSPKSVSLSWQAGDLIAIMAGSEADSETFGTPSATGLSFSLVKGYTGAGFCSHGLWLATAGSTGTSVSISQTESGGYMWGFGAWVWRYAKEGNSAEQHSEALTKSLTPQHAHSDIIWSSFDFVAGGLANVVPTPTHALQATNIAGHYGYYLSDKANAGAGAVSYGLDVSTKQSILILELGNAISAIEASTLKAVSASGAGTVASLVLTGTATPALKPPSVAAAGKIGISGTMAPSLIKISTAGVGWISATGEVAATLPRLQVTAAGGLDTFVVTGTAAIAIRALSTGLAGWVENRGVGIPRLKIPTITSVGWVTLTGPSAITDPAITTAIIGAVGVTGTAAVLTPAEVTALAGWVSLHGAEDATLAMITSLLAGKTGVIGTGDSLVPMIRTHDLGQIGVNGVLVATLKALAAHSSGTYSSNEGFTIGEPELAPGVNYQTGVSYAIQHADREFLVVFNNASPVAVTVPEAIGAFGWGFRFSVLNLGAGTVTFTPTTSTVNGASTLTRGQNASAMWWSDDHNWFAEV